MCRRCLPRRSILAASLVLPWAAARAATPSDTPIEPRVRLANPPPGTLTVALTLDACPGGFDERIANALIDQRVPATIFVTGLWIRRNPAGLALLLAHPDIFAIENHGERHIPPILGARRMFGLPVAGDLATVAHEVTAGAAAITDATGRTPRFYRAATGFFSPAALAAIEAQGVGIGGYSLNGDQGASLPAAAVATRIGRAVNGDIIVSHINQPHRPSGEGVVAGIRTLQQRGAVFARLDQRAIGELTTA